QTEFTAAEKKQLPFCFALCVAFPILPGLPLAIRECIGHIDRFFRLNHFELVEEKQTVIVALCCVLKAVHSGVPRLAKTQLRSAPPHRAGDPLYRSLTGGGRRDQMEAAALLPAKWEQRRSKGAGHTKGQERVFL